MFDEYGKEALKRLDNLDNDLIKAKLLTYGGGSYMNLDNVLGSGVTKEKLAASDKRIAELETKLAAVMELLSITEEKPEETAHKLVKGKKSVSLEKKRDKRAESELLHGLSGWGAQGEQAAQMQQGYEPTQRKKVKQ